ncbi:MAG: hypothetical protein ACD_4C00234G0006 [uncultured bacterium (gcode 4)]|uniref:Uncharacterized protein n=1 Tax=uncultured bacterium (gcode 4) TaxID=1234023 RepID=K2FUJ9_9BACT|nr:MAG: hypothetical protein ACD_4C00234G0006 [uncultured bacterium (gcode 4)]
MSEAYNWMNSEKLIGLWNPKITNAVLRWLENKESYIKWEIEADQLVTKNAEIIMEMLEIGIKFIEIWPFMQQIDVIKDRVEWIYLNNERYPLKALIK